MSKELKSTIDLVMEKLSGKDKGATTLTEEQKSQIAEIRKTYEAKMAEARIMLAGNEELPREIARLQREMEEKIEKIKGEKEHPDKGK